MSPDLERRLREAGEALAGPDAPATTGARGRRSPLRRCVSIPAPGVSWRSAGSPSRPSRSAWPSERSRLPAAARPASREGSGFCRRMVGRCSSRARPRRRIAPESRWPRTCRCTRRTPSTASRTRRCARCRHTGWCSSRASCASVARGQPLNRCRSRFREAVPYIRYGGEVRPNRPLGQYELRAMVEGYAVEDQAYFGTREPTSARCSPTRRDSSIAWSSPRRRTAPLLERPPAADAVTIAFQRFWYPPGNYFALRFYGTISSGQANEYVSVMHKPCRATISTAIAGATTTAGGGWEGHACSPPGAGDSGRAGATRSRNLSPISRRWYQTW